MKCPVADRLALEDLTIAYCSAVDAIGNAAGVQALFTADAIYDLTGVGLGQYAGAEAIGTFFSGAFPSMAHNAHYASNFVVTAYAGNAASVTSYVHAYSLGHDGAMVDVRARYSFDCTRDGDSWKIARLAIAMLIPG